MGVVPGFFQSVRVYFAVTQGYVLRKIFYLCCPFLKIFQDFKSGGGSGSWDAPSGGSSDTEGGYKTDVDSPDL